MAATGRATGDALLVTRTFLFTDIVGSTALWERESEPMRKALHLHDELLTAAVLRFHGRVFKTAGDAFCAAFERATDGVSAAYEIQQGIEAEVWPTHTPLRLRMALHTGPAYVRKGDYFGTTLNRCARLLTLARDGQTLLSSATEHQLGSALPEGVSLRDRGLHRLRDLPRPMHVFQLIHPLLAPDLVDTAGFSGMVKPGPLALSRFSPIELFDVPTLPGVVLQAFEVMQDPKSDAESVQEVINRDPAISAKILRVANSAFFGFARRVSTIADAVGILGFANVQGMIIGVGVFDAFRTERLRLGEFWRHSITTATAARLLAQRLNSGVEEAFTVGILHDIGKLIFAVQAGAGYQHVLDMEQEAGVSALEAERTLLEFTHPEIGEAVAQRWNLPPRYVAAIAHHHAPAEAGDESRFSALIGLASLAAHAAESSGNLVPAREAERTTNLDLLGLGLADWDDILADLARSRAEIDAFVAAVS
jgi:putative nucleotidyltransferase with HDIG domain